MRDRVSPRQRKVVKFWPELTISRELVSLVLAARVARFYNDNANQAWHALFEISPNKTGQVFAGGILQARNFVQKVMIEGLEQRLPYRVDFAVVNAPT